VPYRGSSKNIEEEKMSKTTTLAKPTLANKSKSDTALAFAEAGAEVKPDKADIATTRLNANIPVELHRALKMRAAAEGTSIGELVENWIRSWATTVTK
jgi:predicted HicB family RNase H-like nuclease